MRAELSADREQGAGYGLLRITGLPAGPGPLHFSLRCNQEKAPFLGSGGWQSSEAWHTITEAGAEGTDVLTVPLGPEVIDPIVGQPTNVTYLLTVTVGAAKQATAFGFCVPASTLKPPITTALRTPGVASSTSRISRVTRSVRSSEEPSGSCPLTMK